MKKTFIYAFLSAIALSGATGFTSCSDKEELAADNPNYDPNTNSVVVDVALNISTSNTPTSTRQSSAATQATETDQFRGISEAQLLSFAQESDGKPIAAATAIGKRFDLSQVVTSTQISSTNSRRVLEMSLPIMTNTLIFYGRATQGSAEGSYSLKDTYGSLDNNEEVLSATNMSDITFSLTRRLGDDKLNEYRNVEKLLSGILSCIMNTDLSHVTENVDADDQVGDNKYGYSFTPTDMNQIKWDSYKGTKSPVTTTHDLYPLEAQLGQAYTQMTTIRGETGELRAASGAAILMTMTDLWSAVNKVRCAAPLSKEEAIAKKLADEIANEIQRYFEATNKPSDGAAVSGVTFKSSISTITNNFASDPYWPVSTSAGIEKYPRDSYNYTGITSSILSTFPVSYGLPDGATHIKFDDENKVFYYPTKFNTSGVGGVDFYVTDYLYPAELVYFGNSPIRVSNTAHKVSEYPNGANANAPGENTVGGWHNESSWPTEDWNGAHVTSASRSVAMKNDINYGTALLKTTVKLGATELRDNNHAVQKAYGITNDDSKTGDEYDVEPDKKLTVNDNSFELIGVIVGGQSRNVGWNFLPKQVTNGTSTGYEYGFVSDHAIPATAKSVTTSGSGPNYTLLFDNYDDTKAVDQQNLVYVALEFKNNSGEDFYGNYNLIRNGGTFYLIGALNPQRASLEEGAAGKIAKPTWPTWHALPPYNADGSSKEAVRVFMQDYMTTANFVIGEHSLKYAYLTVPDLRSSSLTLGLSVDIKWETGLNFGEVLLGGNDY